MDTIHTVLRSARHFFCGTFLSRLSGFFRDMAMAFCFGSSAEVAAFFVAFRLANLFRRLLGEGNLQSGFIPLFESLRKKNFAEAVHFYRESAFSLGLSIIAIILGLELFLWALLDLLSLAWQEIALLTMWMLPGLFFICLSGLNNALLQSQKKYFWSAAAPLAFNGVWIAAAFLSQQMSSLAFWITGGFAMQWLITSLQVRKELSNVMKEKRTIFSSEWKRMISLMTLGVVGIGAVQINSALDAIFAQIADPSGPAYLWYAIRVQQLPLALFGLALSGALLPPLSRAIKEGDLEKFTSFLASGLRLSAVLIIPSTLALLALGGTGLNLLYGHGQFHPQDVQQTLFCLWAYGTGLLPSVFVLLLAQGFYAQKSYWIPARASLISVGVNIALNAFLVFVLKWGALSVALSTSVSAWVNCYILANHLKNSVFSTQFIQFCLRLVLAASIPACLTLIVQQWGFGGLVSTGSVQLVQCVSLSILYLGGLVGMVFLLKIEEFWHLLGNRMKFLEF